MPATFEAVRAALAGASPTAAPGVGAGQPYRRRRRHRVRRSGRSPRPGTGSARTTTVLDWAEPALALGRSWPQDADSARCATPAGSSARIGRRSRLPEATDLVTVSYVLGELTAADRARWSTRRPGRAGRRRRRAGHPRRLPADPRGPRPAHRRRAADRRALPAQRSLPDRAGRATGATSRSGSAAPPCTGRSRAARCRTRTRSSATSPAVRFPAAAARGRGWCAARRSARARSCWTSARRTRR